MAKKHSSEAFYALDDPLEAAVFSVLVEMLKVRLVGAKMDKIEKEGDARELVLIYIIKIFSTGNNGVHHLYSILLKIIIFFYKDIK